MVSIKSSPTAISGRPSPLVFTFSSPVVAKKAAGLLKHQLQSVGDTEVKSSLSGSKVSLSISASTPVGKKAAEYTARRLVKILIDLDGRND